MTTIKEVVAFLDSVAPRAYQESYDNAGLLTGDPGWEVNGALVALDATEAIIDEAIQRDCNLVVAHHPIIFSGLKRITGANYVERTIQKAIKNDVAIFAIHTNLDNVSHGVNQQIADKLGLTQTRILHPKKSMLQKLVTFVPSAATDSVIEALSKAGAGSIGNYDKCAFTVEGTGQFRGNENATPTVGEKGTLERVTENRVEMLVRSLDTGKVLTALHESHPYEEVAYYLTALENSTEIGSGLLGTLPEPLDVPSFLQHLKSSMQSNTLKYTHGYQGSIQKVAVCGGSGSFLRFDALAAGADAYVTSDVKYHEFFDAEDRMTLIDMGHYESEVHTKELLHDLLTKNFTNFAVNLAEANTNPISYF